MAEPPLRIAVCGAGRAAGPILAEALAVGGALGRAGAIVLCGGLGGVMEAVAQGASDAGALTVGILPGPDAGAANPHIALPLPTGMGETRNALLVRMAEAVIAIGGEWGTLSEVALAMKIGRPVVLLKPDLAAGLGLDQVGTAEEAADVALRRAAELRRRVAGAPVARAVTGAVWERGE
ncbi:MAG: TIGR00725 family protein [Longimicrobiales bacterium]